MTKQQASYVIVTLSIHLALGFLLAPYARLVIAIGAFLQQGRDLADVPQQFYVGLAASAVLIAIIAIAVVRARGD